MIISVRSISYDDLKEGLSSSDEILVWSCDSCIKACGFGGSEKSAHLRNILREDGYNVVGCELISVSCNMNLIEERKYNDDKKEIIDSATAIVVLACEDGFKCVAHAFSDKKAIGTAKTVGAGGMTSKGALLTTPFDDTGLHNNPQGYTLGEVADKLGLFSTFFEPDRTPTSKKQVNILINGKKCAAEEGSNLLEACEKNGFRIPHLCYRKGLSSVAVCRLCLVKLGTEERLVPACREPVADGMTVTTEDEEIRYLRRTNLEFLLSAHEHNCLLCGENRIGRGRCELQTLVREFGIDEVRFPIDRKTLPIDDSHPVIIKDPNKCVLCGRCVRACSELAGKHNLSLGNRGKETIISSGLNQPFSETDCAGCLACVMSCPTGALNERLLQFEGEKWEPRRIYV